jgi:hypothetical protein
LKAKEKSVAMLHASYAKKSVAVFFSFNDSSSTCSLILSSFRH